MENLLNKKCVPCEVTMPPMPKEKVNEFLQQVPGWKLTEGTTAKGKKHQQISRDYSFDDFKQAMEFVNKVAEIAEAEGHHPDISIHWNKVRLDLWTHESEGLFDNDFILAAKINAVLEGFLKNRKD